ncbi:MAG: hypothetical protein Q4G64_00860 [bacterium]|nr:hypothetical protein [bacterium]
MGRSDGTLINPMDFPIINPSVVRDASGKITRIGRDFEEKVSDVHSTWKGLRGPYEAPEAEQVIGLLDPAHSDAEDYAGTLASIGTELTSFADALEPLKTRMETLKAEAWEFRHSVVNGVRKPAVHNRDGIELTPAEIVPWNEDWNTNERNNRFHGRINELAADLSNAEANCADRINALVTGVCMAPAPRASKEQLNAASADSLPWGAGGEFQSDNCGESVVLAVGDDFLLGTFEGIGSLIGYDVQTGEWWQGDVAAQSWGGLGNFAGSLLILPLAGTVSGFSSVFGVENGFTDFMGDRVEVVGTVGASLVNIDLAAEDPFHRWKTDGVRAGTGSILNVGSFFVPGANVATAFKIGGRGATVANSIARAVDNVVPGSSLFASKIAGISKFGDEVASLGDDIAGLGDDIARLGDDAVRLGDDAVGLGDDAARVVDDAAGFGDDAAGLGDDAARVVDDAAGDSSRLSDDLFPGSGADDAVGVTDDVARGADEAAGGAADAPQLLDDAGRPVPVDESGARVDAGSGREVFVGRDRNLYYEDTGKRVPFSDYPPELPSPTNIDVFAERANPQSHTPSQQYLEGPLAEYADAVDDHLGNRARTDSLLDDLGLTRADIAPGQLEDTLSGLRNEAAGNIDTLRAVGELRDAVDAELLTRAGLRDPGEAAGLGAALDNHAANGMTTIIGDSTPGAARVDAAAVGKTSDGWNLVIDETKGTQTNPSLGDRRMPDSSRVQQGTTEYLNDMFRVDDRIQDSLTGYAERNPGFADAWNAGQVSIEYRLVTARPDGSVVIENFVIDSSRLQLPTIP